MPVNTNNINEIRVGVLGYSVDESSGGGVAGSGQWISTGPGDNRTTLNVLSSGERIITRILNAMDTSAGTMGTLVQAFDTRFNTVVGSETGADQAEFDAIGSNLIQAIHAILTGGGGGGVGEPTDDGKLYGRSRQSGVLLGTWEEITGGDAVAKVAVHEQATADDEWEVEHELDQLCVSVSVFSPGNHGTGAQTILIPEIEFVDQDNCKLHFIHPVMGTAYCRR